MWQRDTTVGCPGGDGGSATITDTSYDIMGLEEDSSYTITVRASNTTGSSEDSNTVTAMTLEAGEIDAIVPPVTPIFRHVLCTVLCSSFCSSQFTSSTITVQWGMVPCIQRNGEIVGYSVRYSGGGSTDTRLVAGGAARQTTISGLTPFTDYTIEVAAVNDAGTGQYSTGMVERTVGEWMMTVHVLYFLAHAQEGYGVCVCVCVCVCVYILCNSI